MPGPRTRTPAADRVPPTLYVLVGIVSLQVGAAIAKNLFALVPPTAMVWMRLVTSAAFFLILLRPNLSGRTRTDWLIALGFGLTLCTMNWAIYNSFARIPLGVAVTIEFLGPLMVSVLGSRRLLDLLWVVLAGSGVALLGFAPAGLDLVGVLLALLAGACWAGYILLSAQTGRRWSGLSGLVVASWVGVVVLGPPAVLEAGADLLRPEILLLGAAIGLLSSVIPYSLELIALRRMPPRVFGILMSLEPAAAALAAMLVLREFLAPAQWIALGCVVAASVGATRTARSAPMSTPQPD